MFRRAQRACVDFAVLPLVLFSEPVKESPIISKDIDK